MPDTSVMPGMPAPMPPAAEKKPKKWLVWAVPLLAFVIGVGAGSAGQDEKDVEATPAFMSLRSELTESQEEANDLADQVAEAEKRIAEATAAGEAQLAARSAELEAQAAALAEREAQVVAAEAAAQAAASSSAAAVAPKPAPRAAPVPAAPAPQASTYYDNCTAARNAGAAPVRAGQPGYGRHLDRDGDGVGCE
ncbi:excalibur calcium-binding domain-containing protein [Blastococcus sp. TF02A-30]|uniref:excalibur calcium-binding domain-containing protein n=1 Tax=Blastococcus sp. TF02A-30 TaxID=2250580 RepID=UPI001F365536|nr:excalibur calcium-binding domain-containing protein [Blastococcus sp. TF02A-30]